MPTSPVTSLAHDQKLTAKCKIISLSAEMKTQKGQPVYCVFAELDGEYRGPATHIGGSEEVNGEVRPISSLYQVGSTAIFNLIGRSRQDPSKGTGTVIEGISATTEVESAPSVSNGSAAITEAPAPEAPKPSHKPNVPAKITPAKNSKLKAHAPETVKQGKIKAVLFGPSGVGKTTLALSFPSPYYFDVEGGAKGPQYRELLQRAGGVYMGPEDGTLSFDTLIEQMQALSTEKHPYKTLIVDSLTKLYQSTIAAEAERLGDKDAFGASKKPAIAAMRRLVMWASRLDMNIWFICHETAEWGLLGGQRTEIGRTPDIWAPLLYELDLVIQATKRGPARIGTVKKSRITAFPDADYFPLEYSEFAQRHGKDIIEDGSKPIVMASAEQIADVKKLLDLVRITDSEIQKGFEKADVSSWEEMTSDQICVWLTFLKKKLSA